MAAIESSFTGRGGIGQPRYGHGFSSLSPHLLSMTYPLAIPPLSFQRMTWIPGAARSESLPELGAQTNTPVSELSVFYREEISATQRAQYDLVVIGQPAQTPFVSDINQFLPAPFSKRE